MTDDLRADPLPLSEGIGLIGLGKMGLPMARNLREKGYRVLGFDVFEPARRAAADIGVDVVNSPAEIASTTALTLVVVGFDEQVREVIEAKTTGLLATARPGHVIAICSTVEPTTVIDAAQTSGAHGVHVVDSPICRGEPAAEDATLLIMLGGDEKVIEAISPALSAMASDMYRLGGLGAGQVGKMLNNFVLWSTVTANYEAMRLGDSLHVDMTQLREALMLSSGNNWALETWTRSRPMPWAEKDMRILTEHAEKAGLSLPLARLVETEIAAIKVAKNAWTEGGGASSSMDAFVRSLSETAE
ncbi:MAG: NAD(P)-dependent oxidoreductase [Microcella sp.]|uniref:NAD(P)-dependent oxidoreductase n=1 Tax=Microcella sp. TaxID=1913979 RepID=UPI0033162D9E